MLGKVLASIADLSRRMRATTPALGMLLRITGNGAANPTVVSSYNVASAVRTGVGVYRITLSQSAISGKSITGLGAIALTWSIAPTATAAFSVVPTVISATVIDLEVYSLGVSGANITRTAYDIIASSTIHATVPVSAGDGSLPEA